jgi:hypothetical protein
VCARLLISIPIRIIILYAYVHFGETTPSKAYGYRSDVDVASSTGPSHVFNVVENVTLKTWDGPGDE